MEPTLLVGDRIFVSKYTYGYSKHSLPFSPNISNKRFFSKSQVEAEKIMLEVHNKGAGVAGVFPFEVAETKVFIVNEFSRRNEHPLKCIMEKETETEGS